MVRNIFLSYSHKDKSFVDRLASDLEASGADIWLDRREIKPGDSIIDLIHKQIRRSTHLLAVLSPSFLSSRFARQELSEARMAQLNRRRIKVVPILAKKCLIPALLTSIHHADFTSSYTFGLQALHKSLGLVPRPQAVLVRNETANLILRKRGKIACFEFERHIECEVPGTKNFLDLNIYSDIAPSNVTAQPGSTTIESLSGLYKLHTALTSPLPLYEPVRRYIYYELHGPYDDPEAYWFYRMPASFDWVRTRVVFPLNRLPSEISAVFETDGVDYPGPRLYKRKSNRGIAYSAYLEPEMARYRTLRFDWKW
jgi:hypothetical protein